MAGDNNTGKGFERLSDLASELGDLDEPASSGAKAGVKPSTPSDPQREAAAHESLQKKIASPPPHETVNPGNGGRDHDGISGGKIARFCLGVIGIVFIVWLASSSENGNKTLSPAQNHYSTNTLNPVVQKPKKNSNTELQYTIPPPGTNNILSISEIRWCIREQIRIEAIRDIINTDEGLEAFNSNVDDYNSRCGSYQYYRGNRSQAKREVEASRSQIESEAIRRAIQWGHLYQPSSSPPASPKTTPPSVPKRTPDSSLQYTKPSPGTDNILSVSEIRWCIREHIRIEAVRGIISTDAGFKAFNRNVKDYNSRCSSYRYHRDSRSQAERDVEARRSQIESEAIRKAIR